VYHACGYDRGLPSTHIPNPELDGNEGVHLVMRNLCRQLACHGLLRWKT